MNSEERNLRLINNVDNYNKWIFNTIKDDVKGRILEIGSGTGNITQFLRGDVTCVEINKKNIEDCKKRLKGPKFINKNFLFFNTKKKFDTIICLNVLEHIEEDVLALKKMTSLLSKKGRIILQLPAHDFLFGTIDKQVNHYRRYSKLLIGQRAEKAGLVILKNHNFNFFGVFGWYWHGKILKLKHHRESDLALFNRFVPFLRILDGFLRFLPGLSILVVLKKRYEHV